MFFSRTSKPGTYQIADSGSFVLPGDAFTFTLKLDDLNFIVDFKESYSSAPSLSVVATGTKSVRLELSGFSRSSSSFEIQIGEHQGAPLSLALASTVFVGGSDNHRVVTYSFIKRVA